MLFLLTLGLSASFIVFMVFIAKNERKQVLFVAFLAFLTVFVGELVNMNLTQVTVYNTNFILWVPHTNIPLFILIAGASWAATIYWLSSRFDDAKWNRHRLLTRLFLVFLISLTSPLIEWCCITAGLWRWIRPYKVNIFWCVGVWQFYFIFILIPVVAAHCFFCRKKDETTLVNLFK